MPTESPPVVGLPDRLDRRLRLGPFPSGKDALKFITYAAAGAVLIPLTGALSWLPIVLVAFAVSVWRPEGEAVDERLVVFLRWKFRELRRGGTMNPPGRPPSGRRSLLRLSATRHAAVLRVAGLPLAYLPPAELGRRFELYRGLLRTLDEGFLLHATPSMIHAGSFLPAQPAPIGAERAARDGYSEIVALIARRRLVRHVYLAVASSEPGAPGIARLETAVETLIDRLNALGLRPTRLRDRTLSDVARRIGLGGAGGAE